MSNSYFKAIIRDILKCIEDNGLALPTSVADYDKLVYHMGTHHRATLSKNGIKCADILKEVNPAYISGSDKGILGFSTYLDHATKLGLSISKLDPEIPDEKFTRQSRVVLTCTVCNMVETITAASLIRRHGGCKRCRGMSKWNTRVSEYVSIAESKGAFIVSEDIESTINSPKVELECITCSTTFTRHFNTIVQGKYPLDCPVCSPLRLYGSMGKVAYYNGVEFDSNFEMEVYKLLSKHCRVDIHVPYSRLTKDSSIKYIADFLVNEYIVVEVSTFNLKYHQEYAKRIEIKQKLAEASGFRFKFINTLAEVDAFVLDIRS